MKKIAHRRYPRPAALNAFAWHDPSGVADDDIWHTGPAGMPHVARISPLHAGAYCGAPTPLTASALRGMLRDTLGLDEQVLRFVCRQVEESGACELADEGGPAGYLIERILHA